MVPPGDAASSIMPTASSGGRSKASTRPKQTSRQQEHLADQRDQHRLREDHDAPEVGDGQPEAEAQHDDAERDGQEHLGQHRIHSRGFFATRRVPEHQPIGCLFVWTWLWRMFGSHKAKPGEIWWADVPLRGRARLEGAPVPDSASQVEGLRHPQDH